MNQIRTRVVVGADHRISGTVPAEVPQASTNSREASSKFFGTLREKSPSSRKI